MDGWSLSATGKVPAVIAEIARQAGTGTVADAKSEARRQHAASLIGDDLTDFPASAVVMVSANFSRFKDSMTGQPNDSFFISITEITQFFE